MYVLSTCTNALAVHYSSLKIYVFVSIFVHSFSMTAQDSREISWSFVVHRLIIVNHWFHLLGKNSISNAESVWFTTVINVLSLWTFCYQRITANGGLISYFWLTFSPVLNISSDMLLFVEMLLINGSLLSYFRLTRTPVINIFIIRCYLPDMISISIISQLSIFYNYERPERTCGYSKKLQRLIVISNWSWYLYVQVRFAYGSTYMYYSRV